MRRSPNLFIIGAMKSGTTSLYRYLGDHPEIFVSPAKEPAHFCEDSSIGDTDYRELFAGTTNEKYLVEGSTAYSKRPFRDGVAQKIHDFNPQARLIYLMRDPFERIVSQYKHHMKTKRETRPLSQAIAGYSDYLTNSYYAYQLRPYLELFGRASLYVDTFESLKASPREFCQQLFSWLGVDPSFAPSNLSESFNVSPRSIKLIDDTTWAGRTAKKIGRARVLKSLVPRPARAYVQTLVPKKVSLDFGSQAFRNDVEKARLLCRPLLSDWIHELEQITGCRYDMWPTRLASYPQAESAPLFRRKIHPTLAPVLGDGTRRIAGQ